MAELVLNRFKVEINILPNKLFFIAGNNLGIEKHYFARYKPSKILNWKFLEDKFKSWIEGYKKENIEQEEYIYINFSNAINNSAISIDLNFKELPFSLQKKYLKEIFIKGLCTDYIIEPYKEGVDLSIYKKNTIDNQYTRFDLVFNVYDDKNKNLYYEAFVSVGSTDSYILKIPAEKRDKIQSCSSLKYLTNNFLIRKTQDENVDIWNYPVKANNEVREIMGIKTSPKKIFYKFYYSLINDFVKEIANKLKDVKIHTTFERIVEINKVDFEKNKMIFKNNYEDYATVNGMRDYGPYYVPEDIKKTQLLFIYPDKESANKLYSYLSRGYRHFPGLESYVGIPANIFEKKINYQDDLNSIPEKIKNELEKTEYSNVLAVCIMPFSKGTASKNESKIYYSIKKTLLEKNIPSQFIHREKIFQENFHFSLPNIAIAMLAKCGGIPWKLVKPHYNQLTVGFNIQYVKDEIDDSKKIFLGTAVFFDNEGIVREVNGFDRGDINGICKSLSKTIENYKKSKENEEIINKIVIHFFKNVSGRELNKIEKTVKENLGQESNFAIVEINDTKTTTELCFDLIYESYMPQSGTYIKLKPNEYMLFNNLRYWEKPTNPINQEELPVKLRIYDPNRSFENHELISQIYEFSRMYWKSLKQKAQPVTTTYAKLIADFSAEFNGQLPDNEVAKKRVWFI